MNNGISMFHTSNERDSFSLYADIFDSGNKHKFFFFLYGNV